MPDTTHLPHAAQDDFDTLNAFWTRLAALETALEDFSENALSFAEEPIEQALEKIAAFEPSVSVIGQIKAGKSTLMNALVGQVNLLPSDVNPWTSVITALHVNSRHRPRDARAVFRFFDQHEWDRLVSTGGRLGEMAHRAGFESEAEEVRAQVTAMRETTESRLGDEFAKLIGSSHAFPELDKNTIDRYICYGDPDDLADGAHEGVYADLTKSADLYIELPDLPRGLCLRDTPGVNDTFMMREQITLNAISDSRVCVVVLSAHQALSTMDLALLRIICSVEAREVLIFVNRIDELEDPTGEKDRIRSSIRKTLERLGIGEDIEILFGSGYWANCALRADGRMIPSSRAALARLYGEDAADDATLHRRAMEASGVPALRAAIARRVAEGPGEAILKDVLAEIKLIIEMSETVEKVAQRRGGAPRGNGMSSAALTMKIADLRGRVLEGFDAKATELRENLHQRLLRSQETFVASALEALQAHISSFGEIGAWSHDPSGLRMMMKTAFTAAVTRLRREGEAGFDAVLDGVQDILERDLGVFREGSSVDFPEQPQHKAPTVLARTLTLDLNGPWWRKYWRFGNAKAAQTRYRSVILAETTPLIEDLLSDFFDPAVMHTREIIDAFAVNQGSFCKAILERCADGAGELSADAAVERMKLSSAVTGERMKMSA